MTVPDKTWADCGSKRRYKTPAEAERQSKVARQKRDEKLRVYRCPHCAGWHLTSKLSRFTD
jgi:DNA-directed RNA polymerase subunit RPC12/RpoP